MREKWLRFMSRKDPARTKAGNLRAPEPDEVAKWVLECWAAIDPETIKSAFLKAGISNDMSGDEDDLISTVFDKDHVDELHSDFGALVMSTCDLWICFCLI
jgi:hypothetical protein